MYPWDTVGNDISTSHCRTSNGNGDCYLYLLCAMFQSFSVIFRSHLRFGLTLLKYVVVVVIMFIQGCDQSPQGIPCSR